MSAITSTFHELRRENETALIGYVMAGDPTPKYTCQLVDALRSGGVDIVELGIPFSDPIADGPILQRAAQRALTSGTTPKKVFEIARAIKRRDEVPLVVMTYYNIIYRMGIQLFCRAAERNGVDGVIVPDMPVEESEQFRQVAAAHNLDTIFLAAPCTSEERLARVADASTGFLYLVSANAVTGMRKTLQNESIAFIKRAVSVVREGVPVAVGFGLSQPSHVQRVVECGAHGVIVGSRFAKTIEENLGDAKKMLKALNQRALMLKRSTLPTTH